MKEQNILVNCNMIKLNEKNDKYLDIWSTCIFKDQKEIMFKHNLNCPPDELYADFIAGDEESMSSIINCEIINDNTAKLVCDKKCSGTFIFSKVIVNDTLINLSDFIDFYHSQYNNYFTAHLLRNSDYVILKHTLNTTDLFIIIIDYENQIDGTYYLEWIKIPDKDHIEIKFKRNFNNTKIICWKRVVN